MDNELLIITKTFNTYWLNAILMCLFYSQYSRQILNNHFDGKKNKLFIIFDLILKKLDCKTNNTFYDIYNIKELIYLFYQNKIISKLEYQENKYNPIIILEKIIKFMKKKVINLNYNKKINPKYSPDYILVSINDNDNKSLDNIINYNGFSYILDTCIIENYQYQAIVGITLNNIKYLFNGWLEKSDNIEIEKKEIHSILDKSHEELLKFDWSIENNIDFCLNISLYSTENNENKCISCDKINRTLIYVKYIK
jgi:hypothetical protein